MSKQTTCNLCRATFVCDNGMWSTTCDCARLRPYELGRADERRAFALAGIPDPAAFMADLRRLIHVARELETVADEKGREQLLTELFVSASKLAPFAGMGGKADE